MSKQITQLFKGVTFSVVVIEHGSVIQFGAIVFFFLFCVIADSLEQDPSLNDHLLLLWLIMVYHISTEASLIIAMLDNLTVWLTPVCLP